MAGKKIKFFLLVIVRLYRQNGVRKYVQQVTERRGMHAQFYAAAGF